MESDSKKLLALIIGAVALTVLAAVLISVFKYHSETISVLDSGKKSPAAFGTQSWPIFRGSQNLLGQAVGNLPNKLHFAWKFKTEGEVKSSPVIDDGIVFVGSTDGKIYAVKLETGKEIWHYQTEDAIEASPLIVGQTVYVGSYDSYLYALDAKNGQLKWKYETGAKILGSANWVRSASGDALWIVVGSYDNILHCLDSKDGSIIWQYETEYYINGSPSIDNNRVVVGGCDAMLHVVSTTDGSSIARIDIGAYIAASAALVDNKAYVGNYEETFICADIEADKILWEYTDSEAAYVSSPAIGNDVVIIGARDSRLHCLNKDTGVIIWTFQTQGDVDSSAVICGDKIIVGSSDGRLYLVNLADGKEIWSYETGQPITTSPAIAANKVIIGCDDGYIYAFDAGGK